MTYWIGQHLQRRIQQFGLEDLAELLTQIGGGQASWPGDLSITPAEPELAEQLRITIYSLLHETGLKPHFRVRMAFGSIVLEQKSVASRVNISPVSPDSGFAGQANRYRPEQGVLGDEGLRELLADTSKPDWLSRPDEPAQASEPAQARTGFTLPPSAAAKGGLGHSNLRTDNQED